MPLAITSVVTMIQLSPLRIRDTASSRSFMVIPAWRQSTFCVPLRTSSSAKEDARGCVVTKTSTGGLYGCARYCNRVGNLDESSATYVRDCEISGSGVSLSGPQPVRSQNPTRLKVTHFRPTTTRMGSRNISIAIFSALAGSVALNTAFWTRGWLQAATISCTWSRNSGSSMRSASSKMRCRTLDESGNE